MSTPVISLLHATKGRAAKALATMRLWAERATHPENIQYVFAIEATDQATDEHFERELAIANLPWWNHGDVVAVRGAFHGSAPAWNAAYLVSGGSLLVQVSDDFEPPQDWDTALLNRLPLFWEKHAHVVAVSDSNRKDSLMTMLVATRKFCEDEGCFLFKGFKSVWSDGDATLRAYKRGCVIEARDLVFQHRHPFFDSAVLMDATYAAQNDHARYDEGEKLFTERHPDWRASGMVNWV